MKKFLLAAMLSSTFLADKTIAQTNNPSANWFEAEGFHYYSVDNCVPGTEVVFYARPWGGKLLKKAVADDRGHVNEMGKKSFTPAFVLNTQSAEGVAKQHGSGKICFLSNKEFSLSTPQLTVSGNEVSLEWKGSALAEANIVFEVLQSLNGKNYTTIASYNVPATEVSFKYTSQDPQAVAYKIMATNNTEGTRYTTSPLWVKTSPKVYPTIISDEVNIIVPANGGTSYKIINTTGQAVASGSLKEGMNTLSTAVFSAGTYYAITTSAGNTSSVKLIKR